MGVEEQTMKVLRQYRDLPRVDSVLSTPMVEELPRDLAKRAAREVLEEVREELRRGGSVPAEEVPYAVVRRVRKWTDLSKVAVINATGVVIHTNLGRAPWAKEAADAVHRLTTGYTNLEVDLSTGNRGGRTAGLEEKLSHLTGAEDALVVNNAAAAVLLALTTLAAGGEVLVSRGQLVEIGGSFRVPEVIASCGARLVEVGATNRTRVADYARGMTDDTRVLLRVHASNFVQRGFVEETSLEDMVELAWDAGVAVVDDLGSGSIGYFGNEPTIVESVKAGADVVVFSGDKLFGGPQAGVCVGKKETIAAMRAHPLYRALRVDKAIGIALEVTVGMHLAGIPTPVERMLTQPSEELATRAERIVFELSQAGVAASLVTSQAYAGGGALPEQAVFSVSVGVSVRRPDELASHLRLGSPAVLCRVQKGLALFDLRTVDPSQDNNLIQRLAELCGRR